MESDFSNELAIWLNIIVLFPQEYLTKVRQTFWVHFIMTKGGYFSFFQIPSGGTRFT